MFEFKLHVSLADNPSVAGFLDVRIKVQAATAAEAFDNAKREAAYIRASHDLGLKAVVLYDSKQVIFVIPKERAVRSVFITSLVQA